MKEQSLTLVNPGDDSWMDRIVTMSGAGLASAPGNLKSYRTALNKQKEYDGLWTPSNRATIHISDMDDAHLDNTIIFLQTKLSEVDAEIRNIATDIAKNPSYAENNVGKLSVITLRQVRLEAIIGCMMEEQKGRGSSTNFKKEVRGNIINTELEPGSVTVEVMDRPKD